jgi:hypothetical protein
MCLGKDFDAPKVYAFGSDYPQFALPVGDRACILRRCSSPELYKEARIKWWRYLALKLTGRTAFWIS